MRQLLPYKLPAIILVFLLSIAPRDGSAQSNNGSEPSRFFLGGNFGLRFGNNTFINISPQLGYQFHERFAAGGGINFITSSITVRNPAGQRLYRSSYGYAGLNVFARVFPIQRAFLSFQPEYNYSWGRIRSFTSEPDEKYPAEFVPSLLVGAGAIIPTGRGNLVAMLQYDISGNARSPYGRNPFVSFGFNF